MNDTELIFHFTLHLNYLIYINVSIVFSSFYSLFFILAYKW